MFSASSRSTLEDLRSEAPALRLRMGRALVWNDEASHRAAFARDAELYALSAVATGVPASQRARALFVILGASWRELSSEVRSTLDRVARLLMAALPTETVLTVLLALRRARANHKHLSRAIVRYVTEHPEAERLAQERRVAMRDLVEHAVGRKVARAAALTASRADGCGVLSKTLPYARDPMRTASLLAMLYGPSRPLARTAKKPTPYEHHLPLVEALDGDRETPRTITATNRGDVSATLVHMYRGGSTAPLERGLAQYVERAAARLPAFDGSITIVLDASASTRGYGEREYCTLSQSVALALVLGQVVSNLRVHLVGSSDDGGVFPPRPAGATDLASALIDAASASPPPDIIAVVTDGYENQDLGDLADVVDALPRAGVHTPVVLCQSKFTFKDDLTLRRPAPRMEEVGFWHEEDFIEVLLRLASRTRPQLAASYLRRALAARLHALCSELEPWTSAP